MKQLPFDADDRAILFLCCAEHVVSCPGCRNSFRLRWLGPMDVDRFPCPLCPDDLTATVIAHTKDCIYFVNRGAARKPPAKVDPPESPARTARRGTLKDGTDA